DDEVGDARERRIERRHIERALRFFPATSELTGTVSVGEKHRGLFKVRTFTWQASARGEFVLDGKASIERMRVDSHIVWGRPMVSVGLTDPRGLVGAPALDWMGERLPFERGSGLPGIASGLHAIAAPIDPTEPQRLPYALSITLLGTESLGLVPVADNNRVSL